MKQRTIVRRRVNPEVTALAPDLHPLLNRLYRARGINSAAELEKDLQKLLPYDGLLNMDEAVACLHDALTQQQHILIVGDFDADGATSSALAMLALRSFGAKRVSYLVPNRFQFGYGLTPEIVAVAAQQEPDLIITVDNGISSIQGVARAKALGVKVLVTDHHLPGSELPEADAIVNPNQPGDQFPSKNLAGVGVIFYVMLALRRHLRDIGWFATQQLPEPNMANYLDLVALGTVADVVRLDKNNRILVHQGIRRMRAGLCRPGIKALLEVAGRSIEQLTSSDLGFAVGPRLNAAGRLDDMSLGIECLVTDDSRRARQMTEHLDDLNKERRVIEADMQSQALISLQQVKLEENVALGVCLFDKNWHQGVVGLLASRIKDRLHRPVIAFAASTDTMLKGSARSVPGLHIRDVLAAIAATHPGLIHRFGGHAMAAGIEIERDNYTAFSQAFTQEVNKHLTQADVQGVIHSDGMLAGDEFKLDIAQMLRDAGPWGQGFPEPVFDGVFQVVEQRLVGQRHLKMVLALQQSSELVDAIAFNVDLHSWPNRRCEKIKAVYRLDVNEYGGRRNVQLLIEQLEAM